MASTPRLTGTTKPIPVTILMNTVLDKKGNSDSGDETGNSHIERGQPIGLLLALTYNTEVT